MTEAEEGESEAEEESEEKEETSSSDAFDGTVTGLVYNKTEREAMNLEAAYGTALLTIISITWFGSNSTLLGFLALAIISLLLLRYMAVVSRFDTQEFLNKSNRVYEFLSIITMAHFATWGLNRLPIVTDLFGNWAMVAFVAVLAFGVIFILDALYRAYRLLWGSALYAFSLHAFEEHQEKSENTIPIEKAIANLFQQIAFIALKEDVVPTGDKPEWNQLREFVEKYREQIEKNEKSHVTLRGFLILAILFVPSALLIVWLLSLVLGPYTMVLSAFISAMILQHIFHVFSLAFGLGTLGVVIPNNKRSVALWAIYTASIWYLFFPIS